MQDWHLRYAANMRNYKGYSIGKLLGLINDPTIISLAGGLPSPDMFLRAELQMATRQRFDCDIDRIMQYSCVRGEAELIDAVSSFLQRDGIHVAADNIMITTSGQQGLDLAGRLFLDPGDAVVVERPTFQSSKTALTAGCAIKGSSCRPFSAWIRREVVGVSLESILFPSCFARACGSDSISGRRK